MVVDTWNTVLRRVQALPKDYYVISKVFYSGLFKYYICSAAKCNTRALGYSKDIMDQLPVYIQEQLPCVIEEHRAIDKSLLDIAEFNLSNGGSVKKQSEMYTELQATQFFRELHSYISAASAPLKMPASSQTRIQNTLIKPFREFKPNNLTEDVIKKFHKKRVDEQKEFRHKMITNLTAEVISLDHTFKEAKAISNRGAFAQDFTGKLNVLNEVGQVIGYWLVNSLSYNEVMDLLKKVISLIYMR